MLYLFTVFCEVNLPPMVYRGPVLPPPSPARHRENILFLAHLIFVDPRNFGPQLSLTKINYQSNKLTVTMTETQKTSTTNYHNFKTCVNSNSRHML